MSKIKISEIRADLNKSFTELKKELAREILQTEDNSKLISRLKFIDERQDEISHLLYLITVDK